MYVRSPDSKAMIVNLGTSTSPIREKGQLQHRRDVFARID